ncbi:AMP-binding protein [Actinomadura keratinilytica]
MLHSPLTFDLTVTSLYPPLISGGQVRVADLEDAAQVTGGGRETLVLKATPAHLPLLSALGGQLPGAGQLVLGGEQLLGEAVRRWRQERPDATVVNEYGPTEATVGCMEYRLPPGAEIPAGPVPIGRARAASGCASSTPPCARCPRASPVSCTWPAPAWPAATCGARR